MRGDLGVGSTDLESWTNMGRVGIRLGSGWGPAEPGHRTGRTGVSQADLALTLGWDPRAPLSQVRPHGQLASGQGSGVTGHRLYRGGQSSICTSQVYLWAGTGVGVPV